MTDAPGNKETAKRTYGYIDSLTKEARKGLTAELNQKYKGVGFNKVPEVLARTTIEWFSKRDKNVRLSHNGTSEARNGLVRMTFKGEMKSSKFTMRLDATFSVSGPGGDSPSYLRDLNFSVDSRDFLS